MLVSVEGVYRHGRVELTESPNNVPQGACVILTFVSSNDINLASQGIDREQAKTLRASLATFSDDWNSPEMSVYDNYDAAKANG
ncbi:hypothetical protein MiYa_03774 [Microcystis aeruginosa NIES-2519]|uniref:Uncharacterized protein n=3 Tax=Microcystis TaxID=1125 RepID=A0A5A5R6W5_MICAE|nr:MULTISPECIES: hypothetical protein [Microcystis]AVQ71469.1 hypothetical protein B5D77_09275 [Microcystis sp. MC19]CCI32880.1 hypothetical protein MICAI_2870013 [Microcystis sp. T1-4]GCA72224.1 hypothetical protein MiYa_03774 [Microcystis aeruginosa NIES-2519]GCA86486.1 hypothetical protein MiHa_04480 [Microcystis aeruginosa NIES-2522]GCA89313.1 hypothetical protein MiTa_02663 [Microcystis aeruginosa NIES-4264]